MYVIDASALLALLGNEAGAEDVASKLDSSLLSTVNLSEVIQKSLILGLDPNRVLTLIESLGIHTVDFTPALSIETAQLWPQTKRFGLSLADRACLALARAMSGVAVTTDRIWATVEIPGVKVHVVNR